MKEQIEKQAIEEMTEVTMEHCEIDNQCGSCKYATCNECLADVLYNKGYRKQSEGRFILFKPRRENRNATFRCSQCGKLCSSYYNDVGEWNFCPNCGAKMKGGAE